MAHTSHVYISTLSVPVATCSHEKEKGALLRLHILCIQDFFRHHVSHGVGIHVIIQLSWSYRVETLSSYFQIGRMPVGDQ